jgi:hypothetical protein
VKRPCTFTLKAWDKDPLSFKSDFLGQRELALEDIVEEAVLQVQEQRRHDARVKALLDAGRMDEMLLEVQKYRSEKHRKKTRLVQDRRIQAKKRIERRKSRRSVGIGSDEEDDGDDTEADEKAPWWKPLQDMWSETQQSIIHVDGPGSKDGGSAEDRSHKYKWDNVRQWKLEDIEGRERGTVWATVELLHHSIAAAQPVGKGREAPNEHPVLEEPERERFSLSNPLGALRFFVGPARLKVARVVLVMVLLLGLAYSVFSTSLGILIRSILLNDILAWFNRSCPDGYAEADAVHDSLCSDSRTGDFFKPQIGQWLQCIGPSVAVPYEDDPGRLEPLCRPPAATAGGDDGTGSGVGSYGFNWELCVNATKSCYVGMAAQLDTMADLPRHRQQEVFDAQCEHGGSHYKLNNYSPDCEDGLQGWFRGVRKCDYHPCRSCVSVTEPVCAPQQRKSFGMKIIERLVLPWLIALLVLQIMLATCKSRIVHGKQSKLPLDSIRSHSVSFLRFPRSAQTASSAQ